MDTEIRGRPSYKTKDKERQPSLSPVQGRRSRPSSVTRSDDENDYDPGSDAEEIQQYSSTTDVKTESYSTCNISNCSKSSTPRLTVLVILGTLLIVVIAVVPVYLQDPVEDEKKYQNCSFDELAKKYPTQDYVLWTSLRIGIEGILNNEKPSPAIYLLLHDGKIPNKNLVKKIVLRSSQCFGPDSKPVELNAKEFSSKAASDDYGVIVELYKEKIKEGSVAVIANLNEIPAQTARALHAICDTYEPIEHKAVIFLTLVPTINKGKPIEIAEKTLLDIWNSKINDYELVPLLTRVTDQVFQLHATQ